MCWKKDTFSPEWSLSRFRFKRELAELTTRSMSWQGKMVGRPLGWEDPARRKGGPNQYPGDIRCIWGWLSSGPIFPMIQNWKELGDKSEKKDLVPPKDGWQNVCFICFLFVRRCCDAIRGCVRPGELQCSHLDIGCASIYADTHMQTCFFDFNHAKWGLGELSSRELTYPTLGEGTSSSKVPFKGDMLVPKWGATLKHGNYKTWEGSVLG